MICTANAVNTKGTLPAIWPIKLVSPPQDQTKHSAVLLDDYRKLKLALDYWCSLWFWPISEYSLLPSRSLFILEMSLILTGRPAATEGTLSWVLETALEEVEAGAVRTLLDDADNSLQVDDLVDFMLGRLEVIEETTAEQRFLHWPLVFADVLSRRSGFDLIVGNPPWVRLNWTEQKVLAHHTPSIVLRNWSADQINQQRDNILGGRLLDAFKIDARTGSARAAFSRHPHNYPLLKGVRPNTYKMFLVLSFMLATRSGAVGLVHPLGHISDPKAGDLRAASYTRLALLLQFKNVRTKYMFGDVSSTRVFGICIYRGSQAPIQFNIIANLFGTETVDESLTHDGAGPVPGIKDANGNWQLQGHLHRIVEVNQQALASFGSILDPTQSPMTCRLPMLHSRDLAESLVKVTSQPKRLGDLKGEYLQDSMWNETTDRKSTPPVFKLQTSFHSKPTDVILKGPVISIANPLSKCPDRNSRNNSDYEDIDLTVIPEDYLPRSNYTPAIPRNQYRDLSRSVPWDYDVKHIDCVRVVFREYVDTFAERTLQCSIIGKGMAHVNVCHSLAFKSLERLIQVCTLWNSLPFDFVVRSTLANNHLQPSFTSQLPLIELSDIAYHRMLQLNCLTTLHADVWNKLAPRYTSSEWSATHAGLELENPLKVTVLWNRDCGLRTDLARRQALLEVDVLVAMALGLSLDDLIQIYRLVFPVMQSFEESTWYDRRGRIVWSKRSGKGLSISRTEWEQHRTMQRDYLRDEAIVDFLPNGPHEYTIKYEAPFTKPDRETDYRVAWRHFANQLNSQHR